MESGPTLVHCLSTLENRRKSCVYAAGLLTFVRRRDMNAAAVCFGPLPQVNALALEKSVIRELALLTYIPVLIPFTL